MSVETNLLMPLVENNSWAYIEVVHIFYPLYIYVVGLESRFNFVYMKVCYGQCGRASVSFGSYESVERHGARVLGPLRHLGNCAR